MISNNDFTAAVSRLTNNLNPENRSGGSENEANLEKTLLFLSDNQNLLLSNQATYVTVKTLSQLKFTCEALNNSANERTQYLCNQILKLADLPLSSPQNKLYHIIASLPADNREKRELIHSFQTTLDSIHVEDRQYALDNLAELLKDARQFSDIKDVLQFFMHFSWENSFLSLREVFEFIKEVSPSLSPAESFTLLTSQYKIQLLCRSDVEKSKEMPLYIEGIQDLVRDTLSTPTEQRADQLAASLYLIIELFMLDRQQPYSSLVLLDIFSRPIVNQNYLFKTVKSFMHKGLPAQSPEMKTLLVGLSRLATRDDFINIYPLVEPILLSVPPTIYGTLFAFYNDLPLEEIECLSFCMQPFASNKYISGPEIVQLQELFKSIPFAERVEKAANLIYYVNMAEVSIDTSTTMQALNTVNNLSSDELNTFHHAMKKLITEPKMLNMLAHSSYHSVEEMFMAIQETSDITLATDKEEDKYSIYVGLLNTPDIKKTSLYLQQLFHDHNYENLYYFLRTLKSLNFHTEDFDNPLMLKAANRLFVTYKDLSAQEYIEIDSLLIKINASERISFLETLLLNLQKMEILSEGENRQLYFQNLMEYTNILKMLSPLERTWLNDQDFLTLYLRNNNRVEKNYLNYALAEISQSEHLRKIDKKLNLPDHLKYFNLVLIPLTDKIEEKLILQLGNSLRDLNYTSPSFDSLYHILFLLAKDQGVNQKTYPELFSALLSNPLDANVHEQIKAELETKKALNEPLLVACQKNNPADVLHALNLYFDPTYKNVYGEDALEIILAVSPSNQLEVVNRKNIINMLYKQAASQNMYFNNTQLFRLESENQSEKRMTEEVITLKILAHSFSVGGEALYAGRRIHYEFLNYMSMFNSYKKESSYSYQQLVDDPVKIAQIWSLISPESQAALTSSNALLDIFKAMPKIIQETVTQSLKNFQLNDKLSSPLPVIFYGGWNTHAVGGVVFDNNFTKANKGSNSSGLPGLMHMPITNKGGLMSILSNFQSLTPDSFAYQINNHLVISRITYLKQKAQKVGNCTIASYRAAEGAAIHALLRKYGNKAAKEVWILLRKLRTIQNREYLLKEYLSAHQNSETEDLPPDFNLLAKLVRKVTHDKSQDLKRVYLIREWAGHRPDLTAENLRVLNP